MKNKLLLPNETNLMYGTSPFNMQYAFVEKEGDNYRMCHSFNTCKDYMHEIIANSIHNECCFAGGTGLMGKNLDTLQIVLLFNKLSDEDKENLYSIKKYISNIEVKHKFPKTLIKEIDCSEILKEHRTFLLTFKKHYVESPVLLHMFIAMVRTLILLKTKIDGKNIIKSLESRSEKDSSILRHALKHNVIDLLFKEHDTITKDLTSKEIYPKEDQNGFSYHSGFGLVALLSRRLSSKAYSDNAYKVLDKHGIPNFNY